MGEGRQDEGRKRKGKPHLLFQSGKLAVGPAAFHARKRAGAKTGGRERRRKRGNIFLFWRRKRGRAGRPRKNLPGEAQNTKKGREGNFVFAGEKKRECSRFLSGKCGGKKERGEATLLSPRRIPHIRSVKVGGIFQKGKGVFFTEGA